ncbi:MAG: hypothetical protein CYPHOPRED_003784, partial [Cyphobasidiales sp. Tagirdzhanova-0007]
VSQAASSGAPTATSLAHSQAASSGAPTATPLAQATSNVSASGGDETFIPGAPNGTFYGTALVAGAQGISHFECWSFPLQASGAVPSANAYAFLLGDLTGTNYNVHPGGGNAGSPYHLPPTAQWVIFLVGGAVFMPANTTDNFTAVAGDMILSTDTAAAGGIYGHATLYTNYSINLGILVSPNIPVAKINGLDVGAPFSNGIIPAHGVISDNQPCNHTSPAYELPSNLTTR